MLTLLEQVCIAGDRARHNDDAAGMRGSAAWVIDGATDLHDAPVTPTASDAAWLAQALGEMLVGAPPPASAQDLRETLRTASRSIASAFTAMLGGRAVEGWMIPICSVLALVETPAGAEAIDLGDCRGFALGADGRAHAFGGPAAAADRETAVAAALRDRAKGAGGPLYKTPAALEHLRDIRRVQNTDFAESAVFGLDPACADAARITVLKLARPAHIILATDGFSALVDRYEAVDAAGLVREAVQRGLPALVEDLRRIEGDDASGARHPRFKRSDDATALLLRLS